MKRRLDAVFVCTLLLLAACGGDNPSAEPDGKDNASEVNPKITVP